MIDVVLQIKQNIFSGISNKHGQSELESDTGECTDEHLLSLANCDHSPHFLR